MFENVQLSLNIKLHKGLIVHEYSVIKASEIEDKVSQKGLSCLENMLS